MVDQFTELTADTRALDDRRVSQTDAAVAIIDAFAARTTAGAWPALDRADIASRLGDLVRNPRLLDQGALNLCGPAAFMTAWIGRHPVAFATFATEIFETGHSTIKSLAVTPRSNILSVDPSTMPTGTRAADWMVLGALRNSENSWWQGSWRGDPSQQLAGMTLPGKVADWFRAAGIYGRVSDEAHWILRPGIAHATALDLTPGTDVVLLINANLLSAARSVTPIPSEKQPPSNWLLDRFPNHFVVALNSPTVAVAPDPAIGAQVGDVVLSVWTWGSEKIDLAVPPRDFARNYFGAVIAHLA